MTHYRNKGETIAHTPDAAVTAGDVVIMGDLPGVPANDLEASRQGAVTIQGVFAVTKGAEAFAKGERVYWDAANEQATRTAAGNKLLGPCAKAAVSGDATVDVLFTATGEGSAGLIYSAVAASAAVTNTTAETAFDKSVAIPANTLKVGDVIRVKVQTIATSTNSTDTLTLRLKIGSTVVIATGAVDVANNDIGVITADLVIRTIGETGTLVGAGLWHLGVPGTATVRAGSLASTTIDTTAAQTISVSAQWSVASASNSVRLDVLDVELLRR